MPRLSRSLALVLATAVPALLSACGGGGSGGTSGPVDLTVQAANSEFLAGTNRVDLALFTNGGKSAVYDATARVDVEGPDTTEQRPLQYVGGRYVSPDPRLGRYPMYLTAIRFADSGVYRLTVHATLADRRTASGHVDIQVAAKSASPLPGDPMPALRQRVLGAPGVTVAQLDSGVPPDPWHTTTVADGLAQHRPMVVYFGQPGFCQSDTCGPTVQVLEQLCQDYCNRMLFEHVEVNDPAGPADKVPVNPAFAAMHFQSEPWVYLVNSAGIVTDRFEGYVTVEQLRESADGTLAGRVPAVEISAG